LVSARDLNGLPISYFCDNCNYGPFSGPEWFSVNSTLPASKPSRNVKDVSNKTKKDVCTTDVDINKLDEEIEKLATTDDTNAKDVMPLVTDFLPWCPSCDSVVLDQKGYACDSCGKTVCRNCINLSKEENICSDCMQMRKKPQKSYKHIQPYNPRVTKWSVWVFVVLPILIIFAIATAYLIKSIFG